RWFHQFEPMIRDEHLSDGAFHRDFHALVFQVIKLEDLRRGIAPFMVAKSRLTEKTSPRLARPHSC
ncbi:MAG: hypothetical protein K9G62_07995, partial [Alphaproteobacteria bacterium]|nr:hypothetical protein [Alphaproteobacteria bacterium]